MINEQAMFSNVVKRLFTGKAQEFLCEILQNSQRSGAGLVDISFPEPSTCVIEDNGHGLTHGVESLRALLVLAESGYDAHVKENQAPMGVGIYALIANEAVSLIRVESGILSFSLKTQDWLHDPLYRESWQERVVQQSNVQGFRLTIVGSQALMQEIEQCFQEPTILSDTSIARYNPISGYTDIMQITVDGKRISLLPGQLPQYDAEIMARYQDNVVYISPFVNDFSGLAVNWYGQMIFDFARYKGFRAYIRVRDGQPVTPQAPTRTALVQNETLATLYQWIEDQIFTWVCRQVPPPRYVKRLYYINAKRAESECPYAVIRRFTPLDPSFVCTATHPMPQRAEELVVRKTDLDNYQFLGCSVICALPGDHSAQDYKVRLLTYDDPSRQQKLFPVPFEVGLTSFLWATGTEAYQALVGVPSDRIKHVWWRPGPMTDRYHTTNAGEWATHPYADDGEVPETIPWMPLPTDAVFVVSRTEGWGAQYPDWIIRLDTIDKMVEFLRCRGWAPFVRDPEPGEHGEESQSCYRDSLDRLIMNYQKTIDGDTSISSLPHVIQAFLPDEYEASQATFTYLYESYSSQPVGIRLCFSDGYTKEIQFYA